MLAGLVLRGDGVPDPSLTPKSERLLDEIERRACLYFYEQADARTGLVYDRAGLDGARTTAVSSIAATGFGLSALAIADRRGYLPEADLMGRVETTLVHLARHATEHRGFYYHFVDASNGRRAWSSELSSVDTAWLLCGVLHSRQYWGTSLIRRLANEILERVDWRWMLAGGYTLSHGWLPDSGFLPYRWDRYAEMMAMYLLALGSTTHPIPAACWYAWERPHRTFDGVTYIDSGAPLFTHQYSHAWFDFRKRRDRYANYFINSQWATRAHRQFCMDMAREYPWYGPDLWGVTASDSRRGYLAWGSRSSPPDGTVVPCAAGGSIAFLPRECSEVLATILDRYGKRAWGRYGFGDAFLPGAGWFSASVIGIDLGIMLLMSENARSGRVWEAMMSAPEARIGLARAGFLETA